MPTAQGHASRVWPHTRLLGQAHQRHKPCRDMSVEDAIELGQRSIYHATARDAASGGTASGAWGDVEVDAVEMAVSVGVHDALWSPGERRGLISRLRPWPFTSCSLPRHGRRVDQGPGRDGRRAPLQGDWRGCALGLWLERRGVPSPYRLPMPAAMVGFLDVLKASRIIKKIPDSSLSILLQYYPDPLVRSSMSVDPLAV